MAREHSSGIAYTRRVLNSHAPEVKAPVSVLSSCRHKPLAPLYSCRLGRQWGLLTGLREAAGSCGASDLPVLQQEKTIRPKEGQERNEARGMPVARPVLLERKSNFGIIFLGRQGDLPNPLDPFLHSLSIFCAECEVKRRAILACCLSPGCLSSLFSTAQLHLQEFQKCRGHDLVCDFCINLFNADIFPQHLLWTGNIHPSIHSPDLLQAKSVAASPVRLSRGLTQGSCHTGWGRRKEEWGRWRENWFTVVESFL